ncbi:MAG: glycerol-3-phosphate 1-O-acyltransferase PlsY [Candidatus Sumerlaeia bacterium]|nr:glycerol-3-phosphate 1-O-acyltransferase PlsY [Candidatus Sumerlaeia bacterium]
MVATALALAAAYLAGAIPTGLFVGKAKGVDLREVGSKNIGFTNAWRVLGAGPGLVVLVVDVGKAFAAARYLPPLADSSAAWVPAAAGIAVLLGNFFNVFLRGKGGKGVATGLGVFAALAPQSIGAAAVVFFLTVAATRYISLGSLLAVTVLLAGTLYWDDWPVRAIAALTWALVVYKHRENIGRLRAGTERKFGRAGSEPSKPETLDGGSQPR